jgi:elongation factor Ts
MDISAEMVRKLREATGAGMMECKKALVEAKGDFESAKEILRKKGLASAASRASRSATDGVVGAYIHHNGKTGVLVEVNCETDFVARTPEFQALVKEIALHVAAAAPRYVTKEEVPAPVIEKEREIYRALAAAQGKPPAVQDKIADGKLKDFYAQFCLLDQPFVRDAKLTVGQLVQEKIAVIKENIVVRRFVRFQVGEQATPSPTPSE